MRAIVNGKLYDTEKAKNTLVLSLEGIRYDIYMTQNGNIFAVNTLEGTIQDSEQLKKILEGKPECTDAYIKIFGMTEEA
jgi:hypothetical protein